MHKSVMVVTAICSIVSFLVGGVRDRHLTEATVVLGVVVANRSGDHGTPSKPFSAISKIFANAAASVAQQKSLYSITASALAAQLPLRLCWRLS